MNLIPKKQIGGIVFNGYRVRPSNYNDVLNTVNSGKPVTVDFPEITVTAPRIDNTWIKDKDVNGNQGYRNTKTGEFRSTLPNSSEDYSVQQRKQNNAVQKTYSAQQATFEDSEGKLRNHGDERIKLSVNRPGIAVDVNGNMSNTNTTELAPNESSLKPDYTLEGLVVGNGAYKLGEGLVKLGLTKTGQNAAAHWARNSLLNEATSNWAKNIATLSAKPTINQNVVFLNNLPEKRQVPKEFSFKVYGEPANSVMGNIRLNADRNLEGWYSPKMVEEVKKYLKTGQTDNPEVYDLGQTFTRIKNMPAPTIKKYSQFPSINQFNDLYKTSGGFYSNSTPRTVYINENLKVGPNRLQSNILHETEHSYQFEVNPYTERQKNLLDKVYPSSLTQQLSNSFSTQAIEKGATNKEYQGVIYRKLQKLLGKDDISLQEMNKYIDGMSNQELLDLYARKPINGYAGDYIKELLRRTAYGASLVSWLRKFRYALKYMPTVAAPVTIGVQNKQNDNKGGN